MKKIDAASCVGWKGMNTSRGRYSYSQPATLIRTLSNRVSLYINKLHGVEPETEALILTAGCCAWCNRKLHYFDGPILRVFGQQWDHWIPASQWGLMVPGRCVLACEDCNNQRSDQDAFSYWLWRKENGLPLRFRTEAEFRKFEALLNARYAEINTIDFKVASTDESTGFVEFHHYLTAHPDLLTFMGSRSERLDGKTLASAHREPIFEELWDLESPLYEELPTELGVHSRRDVKSRIGRAVTVYSDVVGDKLLSDVSEVEFGLFAEALLTRYGTSPNELNKIRRLLRILVSPGGYPDFEFALNVVFDRV